MKATEKNCIELFESRAGEKAVKIYALPQSGSNRTYYRVCGKTHSAICTHNTDRKENIAFLSFSRHFRSQGLPVPEIYAQNLDKNIYLQQDLGDTTLFALINKKRQGHQFTPELVEMYKKVIKQMPKFQITAAKGLDYTVCYPRASFDKQSMMWDANYFKYYFLKLAKIPFDEQELEDDFETFTNFLLQAERNFFLYRDFQSRNIMIVNNEPHFIDYQGGRKGALQYDLASLLFDSKADMPNEVRTQLIDFYIETLQKIKPVQREEFLQFYYGYALIRIMQAMGAYGFRGYYEKKEHFLLSIPFAIRNLEWLLSHINFPVKIPALLHVLKLLTQSEELKSYAQTKKPLHIKINSFSYKRGIPVDESGHGGGFVFDCRAIHNPGRYEKYKQLTGQDAEVIEFFRKESEMQDFLQHVFLLVEMSAENYLERHFTHLMVSFGCTGGQHRSVYCAERLARHLRGKYNVKIILRHREMEMKL